MGGIRYLWAAAAWAATFWAMASSGKTLAELRDEYIRRNW